MSINKEAFDQLVTCKILLMATADPDFALVIYGGMIDARKCAKNAMHVAVGAGVSTGLLISSIIARDSNMALGSFIVGSAAIPVFGDVCELYKHHNNIRKYIAKLVVFGRVPQETINIGDPTGEIGKLYFENGPVGENEGWFIGGGEDEIDKVDNLLGRLYKNRGFRKAVTCIANSQYNKNIQKYEKYLKLSVGDDNNNNNNGDDDNDKFAF